METIVGFLTFIGTVLLGILVIVFLILQKITLLTSEQKSELKRMCAVESPDRFESSIVKHESKKGTVLRTKTIAEKEEEKKKEEAPDIEDLFPEIS